MSFKTPILCDRRIFNKKGKWKSPNNDIEENIFYYEKDPLTLSSQYENGKEELKETMTIVVFGSKPFAIYDTITLENGKEFMIHDPIIYNPAEINILVRDMLKPRYISTELTLE